MIKRITKITFIILCFSFFVCDIDAKSLKQLKDELAKDEANKAELLRKSREVQGKIDSMNSKMRKLETEINGNEKKIENAKEEINVLQKDIKDKQKEIDTLMSFFQITDAENIYMDYVFKADSLSDLIYRQTIVEQLSDYNDNQIEKMSLMIEDNKKLQKDLQKKIKSSESSITSLESLLKEYGLDMNDIDEEKRDVEADIKARKLEIKGYEKTYKENHCDENIDLSKCVKVPISTGFIRPLNKGTVTS